MKSRGLKNLMVWAKPYVLLLFTVVVLSVINPLLYSYVPQFIKYVVDIIFKSSAEGSNISLPSFLLEFYNSYLYDQLTAVVMVGISLIIFQAFRGSIMFLNGYFKGKLAEGISYDMRTKLYTHIQDLPSSYHNNADTGDLIQRCTSDVDTIKGFLSNQLPELIYIISSISFGALQMGLVSTEIMLVSFAVVPITLTASIIYFRYVKKKFEEIEEVESAMTTVLQENVNGVRVVKAFANEKYEIEKFDKKSKQFRDENKKLNDIMALYWGLSDFITMTQYVVTVFVAILLVQNGGLTPGDFTSFLMYIGMIVWPIRGLGRIIGDFGKSVVASKRVNDILSLKTEFVINGTKKPTITGDITFKNVSFKFDDSDKHLLDDVSFTIKAGETVAIIGKTGSGKSTIANILVRILDYKSGNININGVELKDIEKKWVRKNIGIILQDPFLYATTVFENIKIADNHLNKDEVIKAAKMASVHDDIMGFDKGYDTLVGEKGVTLSGGQKQRVAIARMLILEKPVIIFDDSLSAVDTTTDLMIRNALKNRDKKLTTIIITHRITTAKEADKIIVLENGKVSAIGNHDELSKQEGLYKNLWSIQGALEDEFVKLVERGEENE